MRRYKTLREIAETRKMQIQQSADERYKVQQRVTFLPAWLPGQRRFTGGFIGVGSLVMLSLMTPHS